MLGLDPDPRRLWPAADEHLGGAGDGAAPPTARASGAVLEHCRALIAAAGPECVAVKPQVACFEALGHAGWAVLAEVVEVAQAAGLLVIADGKRGDIGITATSYGRAFFGSYDTPYGQVNSLGADALTANPYLGVDSLTPLLAAARPVGGGLFVLARTSNPGAGDLQERQLADGDLVAERVARMIAALGGDGTGGAGLSDVGAVVGATAPQRLAQLRRLMPSSVFLLPGIGAQGGHVEDLADVFGPGPAAGLISASRSIVYAFEQSPGTPTEAARREAARLRQAAWTISQNA